MRLKFKDPKSKYQAPKSPNKILKFKLLVSITLILRLGFWDLDFETWNLEPAPRLFALGNNLRNLVLSP